MINFILGFSITLNIVTIVVIIFGYKYIKNNLFVPKIENSLDKNLLEKELKNFDISKYDWLSCKGDLIEEVKK